MKQEKFNSLMVAIVAISAVFGFVSIAWASFSQQLTISSGATIEASKWDVHFGTVNPVTTTGTALTGNGTGQGTAPTPKNNSTKLSGFAATLKTPGDSVSFTVPVENWGTYKAKILGVTLPAITGYVSAADNDSQKKNDIDNITGKVSVTLTYADGTPIAVNDELPAATVSGGTTTPGTATLKMTVTLDANLDASALPTAPITVNIGDSTIVYGQAV